MSSFGPPLEFAAYLAEAKSRISAARRQVLLHAGAASVQAEMQKHQSITKTGFRTDRQGADAVARRVIAIFPDNVHEVPYL